MSYQVTARKWRPQTFEEVVGQEHITKTLKNAITNNRIAHAYIFAGPRGVGKTTTARILAKSLNCLKPQNGEPCNKCNMCKAFMESQTLDIIEIDGASNRRIEEIRTLRESVKYAPTKGEYKIYIIDEVHMLTTESFNALLKTLEEPPEHTIFIFATTDIHKVPPTIISRCQRFDFRRIDLPNIKGLLQKIADTEKIKIDDQSLTIIAKKADGALRDAQSLFDQVISFSGSNIKSDVVSKMLNLVDEEIYFKISDAIINKVFADAFNITKEIYDNGWNFIDFLNGLIEHFRNILAAVINKNTKFIETAEIYRKKYENYIGKFSEGDLLRILAFLNKTQYELKSAQNEKLKIEISLAHLIGLEKSATITKLISNLDNLPDYLQSSPSANSGYTSNVSIEAGVSKKKIKSDVKEVTEPIIPQKRKDESNNDFSRIENNWKEFVSAVNSEKFTLGSLITHSQLVNITKSEIEIGFPDKKEIEIIESNINYVNCLKDVSKSVFGKKFNFNFSVLEESSRSKNNNVNSLNFSRSNNSEIPSEKTPLIKAIEEQLGGKEFRS